MNSSVRIQSYGRSAMVALGLAVLTIAEFYIAIYFQSVIFLMLIAFFKAIIVLSAYMHVSRLWAPQKEH